MNCVGRIIITIIIKFIRIVPTIIYIKIVLDGSSFLKYLAIQWFYLAVYTRSTL